jgi:hypothetical protein
MQTAENNKPEGATGHARRASPRSAKDTVSSSSNKHQSRRTPKQGYDEGYEAGFNGRARQSSNPFAGRSALYRLYDDGWVDGQKAAERAKVDSKHRRRFTLLVVLLLFSFATMLALLVFNVVFDTIPSNQRYLYPGGACAFFLAVLAVLLGNIRKVIPLAVAFHILVAAILPSYLVPASWLLIPEDGGGSEDGDGGNSSGGDDA